MKKLISLVMVSLISLSLLAACGGGSGTSTPASTPDDGSGAVAPAVTDTDAKEAPMLAEMVAAGEIPALEDRMPVASDIMVEQDIVSLGQYGGSIVRQVREGDRWGWGADHEQPMIRFKQDGSGETEPNVAKDYYANEDATVWTIELREGMRWSDGEPFTADDVVFYYNHMSIPALNEDRSGVDPESDDYYSVYTSKPYNCYQVEIDGVSYWADVEKVDDYTITVTFAAPKPSFDVELAVDNKWMFLPKHFYINYVARKDGVEDDETFPLITEEEALANGNRDFGKQWESYSTMSKDIGYYHWDYAIVPQVRAFIATKDNWENVGETYSLVRNPYFFKTDGEGRQLPYLDSFDYYLVSENEQITLLALSGEFDMVNNAEEYSTIASGLQDTHNVIPMSNAAWSSDEMLQLNQTTKDEDLRALFQDARFREALSIAVDRNLLNETLRNGVLQPAQSAPMEGTAYYDAEWSNKWTEYDVAKANALLDEITEPWDGTEGTYRTYLGTNKEVGFVISTEHNNYSNFIALLESAYRQIGVRITEKIDPDYRQNMLSNDVEAAIEAVSAISPTIRPDFLVPVRNNNFWLSAYGKWAEDGKTTSGGGIEPEGDIMELVLAYDAIRAATGDDREEVIAENVQKIFDLHKDNLWVIGYLSATPTRWVVNERVQNIQEGLMYCDEFRFLGLQRPEQFWVTDAE